MDGTNGGGAAGAQGGQAAQAMAERRCNNAGRSASGTEGEQGHAQPQERYGGEVVPPENFSPVVGEIYRSSFPRPENFAFLQERVRLRSILVLIPEEYPPENQEFVERAGIQLFQVGMSGNKEPFVNIPRDVLTRALAIALDPANHPILIHCNRGKHRTGCLVGCIRKLQNWSLTMIFDEYRRFAFPKARAMDQQFIEMYEDRELIAEAMRRRWLPIAW
ncbi:AaceriADL204Wp [[Ashbya] aceris (nom. inval.)]|nr:AaceriADL204Wp [[Ashbya] aceris (nom. inval.)]